MLSYTDKCLLFNLYTRHAIKNAIPHNDLIESRISAEDKKNHRKVTSYINSRNITPKISIVFFI